jgi:hypothetical protein
MIQDTRNTGEPSLEEEEKPFRIVTIYDTRDASHDAARATAIVLRELGDDVPVDRSSWDLGSLDNPEVTAAAANEAARADMIVIALAAKAASEGLRNWVKQWECKRGPAGGLLAFIPGEEEEQSAELEDYFYETAVSAQMDFLCRKKRRY